MLVVLLCMVDRQETQQGVLILPCLKQDALKSHLKGDENSTSHWKI